MTTRPVNDGGFTLVELLIVVSIIAIVSTLAVAGYRHARISGAEASAIAALISINQAQFAFSQTCGGQRYSPTLAGLGEPAPTTGRAFLSPDLTMDPAIKSGYVFEMEAAEQVDFAKPACNGVVPVATYRVTADPITPGISGLRYFATNTDRAIFADSATYTEDMPQTGSPGHGWEIR